MVFTTNDIPVPEGYARIPWQNTVPGMEVYLLGLKMRKDEKVEPAVYGPYKVLEMWWLETKEGMKVNEIGERLLVKDSLKMPKQQVPSRPSWWKRAWNRMVRSR